MAHNSWVTGAGQAAFEHLREEARLRLAHELLSRTGVHKSEREELYLDKGDLASAGLDDLSGDVWAWFGWRPWRQLARSQDFELAMTTIILQSVGHNLTPLDHDKRHLELNPEVFHHALRSYDELRAAMQRYRQKRQSARAA